jgi:phage terminase large subunit
MFECGPLYTANLEATEDIVINQGGTYSGKTYSIMQVLFSKAIAEPKRRILVIGQTVPNLKSGAMLDAEEILDTSEELQGCYSSFNKTDRIYTFNSGSFIQFKSFANAQDAKSGKRDYSFFNEINGIAKPIFDEIEMRTEIRTFVDYNPNEEFYIHELVKHPPIDTSVKFIRSWHEHNPFLPDKIHKKIEALKHKDEELFKVYARGITGKIEGLVFRNFVQQTELPENAKYVGTGMDFGFNDPTAVVSVWLYNEELWLKEELYQTGLTSSDIFRLVNKKDRYICDSSRPDTMEELKRMGLKVEGAMKHLKSKNQRGSIGTGIDILKRYKLNVIGANLIKEFKSYKWKVDRLTGKVVDEPVDFMNHGIDAVRYVGLNKLRTKRSGHYNMSTI